MRLRTLVTRAVAITAATAAALGIAIAGPAPEANAAGNSWVGGKDLFLTGVEISRSLGKADVVYLASGEYGAEAIFAAPVAVAENAHILMTRRNAMPAAVEQRIRELKPERVVLVGRQWNMASPVVERLFDIVPNAGIQRIGGADRVGTSLEAAQRMARHQAITDVFVVGSRGYSDAIGASSAAARMGAPIIVAEGNASAWADRVIATIGKGAKFHFVGTSAVVANVYQTAIDNRTNAQVDRVAGPDRFATNARLVQRFVPSIESTTGMLVAGFGHGDTIGASVMAAQQGSVLMLSGRYCHDHGEVPSQLRRLGVTGITGIGTRHWITADALSLRVCGQPAPTTPSTPAPTPSQPAGTVPASPIPTVLSVKWDERYVSPENCPRGGGPYRWAYGQNLMGHTSLPWSVYYMTAAELPSGFRDGADRYEYVALFVTCALK